MSRDVPFDEKAICDGCGALGAFDFMGDFFCPKCLAEDGAAAQQSRAADGDYWYCSNCDHRNPNRAQSSCLACGHPRR